MKTNIIYTIALLHILLFTYAAVSKILDFENFQVQLGQSPVLSIFAGPLAIVVPATELILCLLLMIPKYRIIALHFSCFLMFIFTLYIILILNFTSFIPCSCGGVLEKLSWTEHLIFNLVFVAIGLVAIVLHSGTKQTLITIAVGGSVGTALIIVLFLLSESVMHKENPFIRRFTPGSAARTAKTDLRSATLYIAGATLNSIYLTDRKAPLQVYEYDVNLQNRKHHVIKLEREDFPFKALQMKVVYPHFYLYDSTVPIIYKGLVSDWKANIVTARQYNFSDIIFVNDHKAIFRGQIPSTRVNTLATISNQDTTTVKTNNALLQKQIDGVFDTDGTMQYSYELNKLVYTYYYRNQFIITDENLNIENRGNTIDTNTIAKIKVTTIKKSGDTKMATPPLMVNNLTTITDNLLMVNSLLRGKFEKKEVWQHATVIDVYNITNQSYLLSFYVYDENGFRMKNGYATSEALYLIAGHYLSKYSFGQTIKTAIKKQ